MSVVCVLHNMCVNHCMLDAINMLQFICVFFFKCHCHLICTSVTPDCASYCVSLLNLWAFQYILFCFLLICFLKSKIFSERVRMIFYKFILNGLFLFKTFRFFFYLNVCCQNDLMFIENFSVCILNLKITCNCIIS